MARVLAAGTWTHQTTPISAITHYAPVASIDPYGDGAKYKLNFSAPAIALPTPIPFSDAPTGSMQGPRYTSIATLPAAKKITDLF